ncbi:MAG TPA: PTS sugar transporter subunit IIA [Microbacteriaceae bacterium]|nr:PTS sugar transporter subunit IIA [Microbacteriaceae bacterium]
MDLPPLRDPAIVLRARAEGWREAVSLAGAALERAGCTGPGYTRRMIDVVEEFGAYIVIAPGLALAHARPGPDVLADGLSVVTLEGPVEFGHPHNDPVRVVVGLALRTPDSHVTGVAALANVFNDPGAVERLVRAATKDDVRAVMTVGPEASS